MAARWLVLATLGHVVRLRWPSLKSGGGLGEVLEDEMAAMETGGAGHHGGLVMCRACVCRAGRAGVGSVRKRDADLIYRLFGAMLRSMVTLAEIETLAFKLPESDRARLAAGLLDSLSGVLLDDDEGLAEALRRSEEMDRDPSACLAHEEFLKAVGRPA